jgi:hypothetical protein
MRLSQQHARAIMFDAVGVGDDHTARSIATMTGSPGHGRFSQKGMRRICR